MTTFQIGQEVIRLSGKNTDEIGVIVELEGTRARVKWTNQWGNGVRTWCAVNSIGLTSEWEVITVKEKRQTRRTKNSGLYRKSWLDQIIEKKKVVRK